MPNVEDLRELAPTAARGHNLVVVTPPSPAYATPVLGGMLSTLGRGPDTDRRGLLLCPAAEVDEWGAVAQAAARGVATAEMPRIQVAHGTARATRRLKAGEVDLLVASPETALALLARAALKAETLASVFLAWPERWAAGEDDPLSPLMQDLPKESQRLIVTALPDRVHALVERYARKALTVGVPEPHAPASAPAGPVQTVGTSWTGRVAALASIIEVLDPASFAIWTADRSRHGEIERAVPLAPPEMQVVTGDAPDADLIVAFDLPSAERLRQLIGAGDVVLLVPPATEAYVERIASPCRPLRLPSLLDAVTTQASSRRAAIVGAIEAGNLERALLTLAPLFERHDPAAVAAGLFELWIGASAGAANVAPSAANTATARIFVGVGKKDGVTVNDVVAALTKDVKVDRTKIGRIELRDAFTLVELPAQEAEEIARALSGTTIRRKRVTARLDRGSQERPRSSAGSVRSRSPRPPRAPRPR